VVAVAVEFGLMFDALELDLASSKSSRRTFILLSKLDLTF